MLKFRKKPIVVSAEQWSPGEHVEGVFFDANTERYQVMTLEGPLNVSPGDWIITGIEGERYPCKPSIFEQIYERVEG